MCKFDISFEGKVDILMVCLDFGPGLWIPPLEVKFISKKFKIKPDQEIWAASFKVDIGPIWLI